MAASMLCACEISDAATCVLIFLPACAFTR
jgi:hypothetical protein